MSVWTNRLTNHVSVLEAILAAWHNKMIVGTKLNASFCDRKV